MQGRTNKIQTLDIKPGKICWAAYCALDKPTIDNKNKCRVIIEDMVIAKQKSGYDNMLEEAIDIIHAYS